MKKLQFNRQDISSLLIILVAALIIYGPVLVPGKTLLPADLNLLTPPWSRERGDIDPGFVHILRSARDPILQFYPARQFLADSLRKGWLPLWNSHAFCGTPFAGDGQSAVFYPPNWLFAILPLSFAFAFVAFLHTLFTGIFFFLYGRRVGWSAAGSTAGALVWMLCGVQIGWQMWQVVDSVLCWMPLCLFFWEGIRQLKGLGQLVGLAAALGMAMLAGHLQFAFYVLLTTFTYALYRPINVAKFKYAKTAGLAIACIFFAAGLSAVQTSSTADLLRLSVRISSPLQTLLPTSLSFSNLGLLVMPEIFGGEKELFSHPFISGEYYEKVIFCGVTSLLSAIYALRLRRNGDLSRYYLGLAVFAILMGCGTPLYNLFYYTVPLYKSFHGLSRAFVLFDFAIAALSASGITLLSLESVAVRRRSALAAGISLCLLIVLLYRMAVESSAFAGYLLEHSWLTYGLIQLGIALIFAAIGWCLLLYAPKKADWLIAALIAADMLLFAYGQNPGSKSNLLFPTTPETAFVSSHIDGSGLDRVLCIGDGNPLHSQLRIMPNSAMALGWNEVSGSDPLFLSRYKSAVKLINNADTGQPEPYGEGTIAEAGNPALDLLDVRWIVCPTFVDVKSLSLAMTGAVNIYENNSALGAAWLIPSAVVGLSPHNSVVAETYLLSRPPKYVADGGSAIEPQACTNPGTAIVRMHGIDQLSIFASPAEPTLLVVSQTRSPGWVAKIDGQATEISTVDGLLTGISLRPGRHLISLAYVPSTVIVGLYATCLSVFFAAMLLARSQLGRIIDAKPIENE